MDLVITFLMGVASGICAAKLWFIDDGSDQNSCAGHVVPNFTPPKPKNLTKVNVDRYGNEIDIGDTVWYQGEKWTVNVWHCMSYDYCRLHLINSSRNYWQWAGVEFVKKVVRADSHTDHAT